MPNNKLNQKYSLNIIITTKKTNMFEGVGGSRFHPMCKPTICASFTLIKHLSNRYEVEIEVTHLQECILLL